MPRLGGRYRHLERAAGAIQIDHQLTWRHVIAQQHFVADDGAVDVVVLAHRLDQRNQLAFTVVAAPVDPGTCGDIELGFTGGRSEEHTSELQSLMRSPYAV